MKLFDKVRVYINTPFGKSPIEFTVIAVLDAEKQLFALVAQQRIVAAMYDPVEYTIQISSPIDLFSLVDNIDESTVLDCQKIFDHEVAQAENQLIDQG